MTQRSIGEAKQWLWVGRVLTEALRAIAASLDGELVIDLEALAAAVRAVVIEGAGGRITFDGRGENIGEGTPVRFQIVEDGLFVPLSAEPAAIEPPLAPPAAPPAVPRSQGGGSIVTARASQIGYAGRAPHRAPWRATGRGVTA